MGSAKVIVHITEFSCIIFLFIGTRIVRNVNRNVSAKWLVLTDSSPSSSHKEQVASDGDGAKRTVRLTRQRPKEGSRRTSSKAAEGSYVRPPRPIETNSNVRDGPKATNTCPCCTGSTCTYVTGTEWPHGHPSPHWQVAGDICK